MKAITIDNRDLHYTIDTYGYFTLENEYDSEVDYYLELWRENHPGWTAEPELDYETDHAGYVKHLAECSVDLLNRNLKGDIVKSIELVKTASPSFYNYTTDSYTAIWKYTAKALNKYVDDNLEEFKEFVNENWTDFYKLNPVIDGQKNDDYDAEYLTCAMLDFYTSRTYDADEYIDDMYEAQQGYEYITVKEAV